MSHTILNVMLSPQPDIFSFPLHGARCGGHDHGSAAERGEQCAQDHTAHRSQRQLGSPGPLHSRSRGADCLHLTEGSPAPLSQSPACLSAWHPSTTSLCFLSRCPKSDPCLPEPPRKALSPDPRVMKGINTAEAPAQPSHFQQPGQASNLIRP